jgi:hypothetical protein
MFATPTHKKSKPAAEAKARVNPSTSKKEPAELNPAWQSLALSTTGLQAKLAVSAPDDPYEKEADRVADRVMGMATRPLPFQSNGPDPAFSSITSFRVQRTCGSCEDEEEKQLQRKEQGVNSVVHEPVPSIVNQALSSPGEPLEPATRAFFEPRFGFDFSDVRLHRDARAFAAARAVKARAFTAKQDVVFGSGQYEPESGAGQKLLAHELTHVVQKTTNNGSTPGADVLWRTPFDEVFSALNRADEIAGVGDFPAAFRILNGLAMQEMLDVLAELARRQLLALLTDNIGLATDVNRPRIETAIGAVRLRPPGSPEVVASRVRALGPAYTDLPADQQGDILQYISGSRAAPPPPNPPPNLSTTGADAFEPGMASVPAVTAKTDRLWVENEIASTDLSRQAPWTFTITYTDASRLTIPLSQFAGQPQTNPVTIYRRHRATQRIVPFVANSLDPAFRSAGSIEAAANIAQPRFDTSTTPRLCALLNQAQMIFMAIGILEVLQLQLANPVVAGGIRPGPGSAGATGAGLGARALAGGGGRQALTFVEIGAGDLQASIRVAREGVRVIAVDTAEASPTAVRELETLGGTFIRGQATNVPAAVADHVFQYFPWRITGTGRSIAGGTWRLVQDTLHLLKPGGAAHFVTEELETAQFLAREASQRGLRAVITETTAGAAAPGAAGSGVPGFSSAMGVFQVNIYSAR